MDNMNKMKIRLNATADVREFVRAAEKCDFDVDIQYDSTIVQNPFLELSVLVLPRFLP